MPLPFAAELRALIRTARARIAAIQDWRRTRFHIVWTSCAAILLATGVAAKSLYRWLGDFTLAVEGMEDVIGSVMFVGGGFGIILNNALALLFYRRGLEREYQPTRMYYVDSDIEVSRRGQLFVGYPMLVVFAVVGLWLWVSVLGRSDP